MTTITTPLAATASSDADYERLGLARHDIKAWEDGARTDDRPGTYEWWYFDAHLDDGARKNINMTYFIMDNFGDRWSRAAGSAAAAV